MRKKVALACRECKSRNYSTNKTEQKSNERLQLKKFCSQCGSHTVHEETK
ncbi:50S ribosomal protein L33 [Texcoconibacillus texcoconensis]|nr:50S ribosomal protein L33 [Texcoconibacillus texcoconensis]